MHQFKIHRVSAIATPGSIWSKMARQAGVVVDVVELDGLTDLLQWS